MLCILRLDVKLAVSFSDHILYSNNLFLINSFGLLYFSFCSSANNIPVLYLPVDYSVVSVSASTTIYITSDKGTCKVFF